MICLVDTHCHLDLEAFNDDRDQVLARAAVSGVTSMVLIGFNPERWRTTEQLSDGNAHFVRAVGLHPNNASEWSSSLETSLVVEAKKSDVVAIGEIGLDFFRNPDDEELQRRVFHRQMENASNLRMPVIIHQRSAESQTLDIVANYPQVRGVMHCFGGDVSYASCCLELGYMLGIGGIVTFRNAPEVREAVKSVPVDRIIVETDAPYLAPEPWRGKRNEPAYIRSVISTIAEIKEISEDEVGRRTTENAIRLFGPTLRRSIESAADHLI